MTDNPDKDFQTLRSYMKKQNQITAQFNREQTLKRAAIERQASDERKKRSAAAAQNLAEDRAAKEAKRRENIERLGKTDTSEIVEKAPG